MKLLSPLLIQLTALSLLPLSSLALPALSSALPSPSLSLKPKPKLPPVPIVIWHGLGDRFDAPGLLSLKADLEAREDLEGVFVHIVKVGEDGAGDQRATFFGSAQSHIALVCDQLRALPELVDPQLNPHGVFDALGFSQGGQLLRGVVEKCGGEGGLKVRNLVTVGSQHLGISSLPPCPPTSSPFSPCRLMHLSLLREGVYSSFAQRQIIPAQYWRDQTRIEDYLRVNQFLTDVNNERRGDRQPGEFERDEAEWVERGEEKEDEPRNATYKENFSSLNRFVMLRFSEDLTVVPPHSSHFTLPHPNASNCPVPPAPTDPSCYPTPLPWTSLPLYTEDYIGLRYLDKQGRVVKGVCEGAHMEITDKCWEGIGGWFGEGGWEGPKEEGKGGVERGEEVWYTRKEGRKEEEEGVEKARFVVQL